MNLSVIGILVILVPVSMNIVGAIMDRWIFGEIGKHYSNYLDNLHNKKLFLMKKGCAVYTICGFTLGIACMTTILNAMVLIFQIIKDPLYSLKLKKKHILGKLGNF